MDLHHLRRETPLTPLRPPRRGAMKRVLLTFTATSALAIWTAMALNEAVESENLIDAAQWWGLSLLLAWTTLSTVNDFGTLVRVEARQRASDRYGDHARE
jgi:hypothetical protein